MARAIVIAEVNAMAKVELEGNAKVYRLLLEAMPVGLEVRLPSGKGMVKRNKRNDWCLFADDNKERSRWGDLDQMTSDVTFFEANGKLPPADMPRW